MTELPVLYFFLGVVFLLAPLMTSRFFLNGSAVYSRAHAAALSVLVLGGLLGLRWFTLAWPAFCAFGFFLYLTQEDRRAFTAGGLASCIPFAFSLISSAWFVAGVNDLLLLGYDRHWSFYAALHAGVLGWFFIGCLAYLSRYSQAGGAYAAGCYLSFVLFLLVAFGIDGVPYIKRVGVIGFAILVPLAVGAFAFGPKKRSGLSSFFAGVSFFSIVLTMALAVLNEYWSGFPKAAFGMPFMTMTHGLINTVLAVPCFFLAIRLDAEAGSAQTVAGSHIVFFDGLCALCDGTVAALLKIDENQILRYSPLQGKYAERTLEPRQVRNVESIVFLSGGRVHEKADAVIHILTALGGVYQLAAMFLSVFPLVVLDKLYDLVADNRYRVFGKLDACLVPTNETKHLFIP